MIGVVEEVCEGSPMALAGVQPDDIIVRFLTRQHYEASQREREAGGRLRLGVQTYKLFQSAVRSSVGAPIQLTIYRPSLASWLTVLPTLVPFRDKTDKSATRQLLLGLRFKHTSALTRLQGLQTD